MSSKIKKVNICVAVFRLCLFFQLLSERENMLSEVDDLKQITEAAKRERVLAIDEKDQLLRE